LDIAADVRDGRRMERVVLLAWETTKDWLSASTGLSHHDFHLILGVLLTLGITRALRLPVGALLPLLIVFGLELINEAFDYFRYRIDGWPWVPGPTLVDIYLTMAPSLIITLAARWNSTSFLHLRRRLHHTIAVKII
jgi:hypothetical protein